MNTFFEVLKTHIDSNIAMIIDDQVINYSHLIKLSYAAAKWFLDHKISKGDIVVASLVNPETQIILTLGLLRIGAVQVPVDPQSTSFSYEKIEKKLGAFIFLSDKTQSLDYGVRRVYPPRLGELDNIVSPNYLPNTVCDEDLALFSHGSGTTGDPKLLPLKHKHIVERCRNFPESFALGEKTMILQRHTSTTYLIRALSCLYWGGCLVEVSRMRMGALNYLDLLCNTIDDYAIDHLHCTVPHAKSLVQYSISKKIQSVRFPHLKSMMVGASPVSKTLRTLIKQKITPNLHINYGTNESGPILRATTDILKKYPDAIGLPGVLVNVDVIDPHCRFLGPNQNGMLVASGPCVIDNYIDDLSATQKAFSSGWFRTGDIGFKTSDGVFHFLGRADDMMLVSGFNVYPIEIEHLIESIPEVKEAAVTPIYSDLGSDLIIAFVVLSSKISEKHIINFCRSHLGWKAPNKVFFVDTLPRNTGGKLLRRDLIKMLNFY